MLLENLEIHHEIHSLRIVSAVTVGPPDRTGIAGAHAPLGIVNVVESGDFGGGVGGTVESFHMEIPSRTGDGKTTIQRLHCNHPLTENLEIEGFRPDVLILTKCI